MQHLRSRSGSPNGFLQRECGIFGWTFSLGVDVDDDFRLIDATGIASSRLFAIGPPIRGVLWETMAVADFRRQCSALAVFIAAS